MSWKGQRKSGLCEHCGTYRERLQYDHIIPRWKGGSDAPENRQWLCANCHEDKTRADISERHKGHPHTPEHIAKRAAANTGKTRTPEQRARISAAASARAARMGPDHYRAMRAVRNGQPWSAARRAKYDARIEEAARLKREQQDMLEEALRMNGW